MEQTEEFLKAIELAKNGGWMPIVTITTVFSLVISLLLVIWKMTWNANNKRHVANEKRHEDTEKILIEVTKTNQTMALLLTEVRTTQKYQQKEIDKILS